MAAIEIISLSLPRTTPTIAPNIELLDSGGLSKFLDDPQDATKEAAWIFMI